MDAPFETAEKKTGLGPVAGSDVRRHALSLSPGLTVIEGSRVPGSDRLHVRGPQQMPADPVAAGLDMTTRIATATERRVVTPTGDVGSGPHNSPAADVGDTAVPDAAPALPGTPTAEPSTPATAPA